MRNIIAAALFSFCALAQAQPIEFKGVQMGASVSDLRNGMGDWFSFSCAGDEAGAQSCLIDGFTYANEKVVRAVAQFDAGRLASVTVVLEAGPFDAVAAALRSKYGAPKVARKSVGKNAYGAAFPQREIAWYPREGGAIWASLQAQKVNEATVVLMSPEALAASAGAAAKKPAAKKDL